MNVIDKFISAVSPIRGARRAAARKSMALINSGYGNYGANLTKKSMRGWLFHGGSSKEDIEDNIDVLRQRSRDAYMGVPVATGALKTLRTNVLAGGLIPSPKIDADYLGLDPEQTDQLQRQIRREFGLWADTSDCDADGLDNFYKIQQLMFLGYLMNGDSFAVLPMEQMEGQPYELRIRLIEADRICSPYMMDRYSPCVVDGYQVYQIVQGVETDRDGKVIAYWVCSRHPLASVVNLQPEGLKWTRVEARGVKTGRRNILHMMVRERAGQVRGVPILAPVLETLKQLGRYTDAEVTAALISSMFTVFVMSQSVSDDRPLGEMFPDDMLIDKADDTSIELGPGAIVSMNPGETVSFADPKHPNTGYDSFVAAVIKQVAAALELPPEVLFKQFSTSYSAARGALNEFWRVCGVYRDWVTEDFCQPIYEMWFAEAVAKGRIQAPGFFSDPAIRKAYTECTWNGPARTSLNPVHEVNSAVMRIGAGISTAQEETIQMTGGDYSQNIKQRLIEAQMKKPVDDITGEIKASGGSGGGNRSWGNGRNDE